MTYRIIFLISNLMIASLHLRAQDEINTYKIIFHYADSLAKCKVKGNVNKNLTDSLEILDKGHPAAFFQKAGELLQKGQCNDAALIYLAGCARYRYFNSANPDYQPSNDGAMFGALNSIIGEPVNIFLRLDIDNYIGLLEIARKWINESDYLYFPRNKNQNKYNYQTQQLNKLITELSSNREKYKTTWQKDITKYRNMLLEEPKH